MKHLAIEMSGYIARPLTLLKNPHLLENAMKAKQLPEARIYELGLQYWPYALSQAIVLEEVEKLAPQNGRLLDIMCGPGNLLGRIAEIRPDLELIGVDKKADYIRYGKKTYAGATFERGDVLTWQPAAPIDMVVCTGSLHHVPYPRQEHAIANIASVLQDGKFAIIADCYIGDYTNETERKLAAEELGHAYSQATIKSGAPAEVIAWTMEIQWNDVFEKEWKTSTAKRLPILEKYFSKVQTLHSWPIRPENVTYGDYIHICYK